MTACLHLPIRANAHVRARGLAVTAAVCVRCRKACSDNNLVHQLSELVPYFKKDLNGTKPLLYATALACHALGNLLCVSLGGIGPEDVIVSSRSRRMYVWVDPSQPNTTFTATVQHAKKVLLL